MAVYRTQKQSKFTIIDNAFLQDKQLSLQAKGLLTLLLSLPEDWDYSVSGLAAICREGKDAIRSAIHELENTGHLVRTQSVDENGRFSDNVYDIYEGRVEDRNANLPITDNPSAGKPLSDIPTTASPAPDDTPPEKRTQKKKKERNTKQEKTNQSNTDRKNNRDADFERLWAAYPCKENKSAAYSAFLKVDISVEKLIEAIEQQRRSRKWCAEGGRYIPYLSNWLQGKRWEDITSPATAGYIRHDDPISPDMLRAMQEMLEEPD